MSQPALILLAALLLSACTPASSPLLLYQMTLDHSDCNQDGRLTWSEVSGTTYHVRGETTDRSFTSATFTQADSNDDQLLTLSELRAYFADKNCDGFSFKRNCP